MQTSLSPGHKTWLLNATGASKITAAEVIQSLWSGYGEILRLTLKGAEIPSVILKHVHPPVRAKHPRGWNSQHGHQRKLKSYQVETAWYQKVAQRCPATCRVPKAYATHSEGQEFLLVLEDLNASGYPLRKSALSTEERSSCIHWLAHFHANFLGAEPTDLWTQGAYWHLATRPDEWTAMADSDLKVAADWIDTQLNRSQYRTLIHGDAKVANFCFAAHGKVAAVDFQYVGGGCGMRDLAYFMGSCLDESDLELLEAEILSEYFQVLSQALSQRTDLDCVALESEWRALYPFAWADFQRFLLGWMPGHQKINAYALSQVKVVLARPDCPRP